MPQQPPTIWTWIKADAEPAAPAVGRKPMTRAEVARHAALVRWKKKNPLMGRVMAIREKRKAKGGGGGAAAPKPDKAAEKDAVRAKNLAAAGEALLDADAPLSKSGLDALAAFAKGEALDPATAKQLAALGVVTLGADGTPRLSPDGKRIVSAAQRGDVRGAIDAAFAAGEKVGVGAAGETLPGWETLEDGSRAKKPEADAGAAPDEKKPGATEKPPKKGGGGGGGGGKEEKKPEADKDDEKAQQALDAAESVGLKPRDLDALRKAADGDAVDEADVDGLAEDGLVEPDGKGGFITTDAGRRALRALERGDVRGYRAALQDVEAARGRRAATDIRRGETEARRGETEARRADAEGRRQQAAVERDKAKADKDKAAADKEAAALDDLADDFRRGRRGLSFAEQRKLIRAGRARLNGEKFELKRLALELDLLELSI